MIVTEWLAARQPPPPPSLDARLRAALAEDARGGHNARELPELLLDAGVRLLEGLLREERVARDQALDLLAADALVTYAFEAASDDPGRLEQRASLAMRRVASLAAVDSRVHRP